MTRLNTTRFALSVLLAGSALAAVIPAQAQPMMGDMGMHHDDSRMHERMTKQMEKNQADLKAKLHLAASQEGAWNTFVQATKPPAKPIAQGVDRAELAALKTPERLDKMNAVHLAHQKAMETHMKQRNDAIREFYNHLSTEQQNVFDAETLRGSSHMMGPKGKRD
jgi:protein CpxP